MSEQRDVVIFATADWDTPYWTNKQHTASHLEKLGWRVLYVESIGLRAPTLDRKDVGRIIKRLRRGFARPHRVSESIWVLSPLAIPYAHHVPAIRRLNQGFLGARVRRFLQRHRMVRPLIWTYHPFVLEACCRFPYSSIVYHCVDDLAAVPGVDAPAFVNEEHRLLERADVVFTTSQALQKKCAARNSNTHFFPNVADYAHFARARLDAPLPRELAAIAEPRLAYMGAISDFKVDLGLLLEAARLRPDWSWVFIGDEREGQQSELVAALRKLPNVHLLGFRSYDVLPDYLRGIAVGLIPSLVNDYTRSMFPMKYFEYLAAGIPVIATPLDFTRSEKGCVVVTDAGELVRAAAQLIARGQMSESESRDAVGKNTWGDRLQAMLALLPKAT